MGEKKDTPEERGIKTRDAPSPQHKRQEMHHAITRASADDVCELILHEVACEVKRHVHAGKQVLLQHVIV